MDNKNLSEYSEDYKHFDNLIWQIPTWSVAIFTGILIGANEIIKDTSPSWPIEKDTLLALIFFSGFIFLFTLSYTLHRFSCHQLNTKGAESPCRYIKLGAIKLGAQFLLQFTVSYLTTVFFALFLYTVVHKVWFTLIVAVFFIISITYFYERKIYDARKRKETSKGNPKQPP